MNYVPSATAPRTVGRINFRLLLLLAAAAVAVGAFFLLRRDAEIYVDNGGPEPITVFVDGSQKLVVEPGQVDSFSCRAGSLQIVAKRGDRVVFDATKTIERERSGRRKYLLNPEATNRYRVLEVQYGTNFPEFRTYTDDEAKARLIAEGLDLVQATDWIDVDPDHVLESAPSEVSGKFSASRKVLIRVPKSDADFILTALTNWDKRSRYDLDQDEKDAREKEYFQVEQAADRIKKATPE